MGFALIPLSLIASQREFRTVPARARARARAGHDGRAGRHGAGREGQGEGTGGLIKLTVGCIVCVYAGCCRRDAWEWAGRV